MESSFVSTFGVLVGSVRGTDSLLPRDVILAVRRAVGPEGLTAVLPVLARRYGLLPDSAMPTFTHGQPMSAEAAAAAMRAIDENEIMAELVRELGDPLPQPWQAVGRDPVGWLARLATAIERTAAVIKPVLASRVPLADRRVDQLAALHVRGQTGAALGLLSRRMSVEHTVLSFDDPIDTTRRLGTRRLVLVPMISGAPMIAYNLDLHGAAYIGFPAATFADHAGRSGAVGDALEELLGQTAAQALRCLARPMTMGQLAASLNRAPSTTTQCCDRLERIGLVQRTHRGRDVVVSLMPRGMSMIDLMSS